MDIKDWIQLLLLSLVWGVSFLLIEIALFSAQPLTIVMVRVGIAALLLHVYCLARGTLIRPGRSLAGSLALMGFLANALPFTLIVYGQTQVTSGLSATLIAATPLFTILIAHVWGRQEKITAARAAGVGVGLAGVALLMGPDVLDAGRGPGAGALAICLAALSYAASAVFGRRFSQHPPAAIAAWMLTFATIFTAPLAFIAETPFMPMPSAASLVALFAMAAFSTALAYILYFSILARAGATNAMLVTFIQPLLATWLGIAFLGETVAWHQGAGLAIILIGLALVDGRLLRARVRPASGRAK
ncbi:MAG: DMT family transporter [Methyloligellaceae bacterium]